MLYALLRYGTRPFGAGWRGNRVSRHAPPKRRLRVPRHLACGRASARRETPETRHPGLCFPFRASGRLFFFFFHLPTISGLPRRFVRALSDCGKTRGWRGSSASSSGASPEGSGLHIACPPSPHCSDPPSPLVRSRACPGWTPRPHQ